MRKLNNLGSMYYFALRDTTKAMVWFRKAAEHGNVLYQTKLAIMYSSKHYVYLKIMQKR